MSNLTLEQIVAAQDLGDEAVDVPEWGGTVQIRGLGYGEWVDIREQATVGGQQDERIFARLLFAAALSDPVVTPEQADLLISKSASAVNRLVDQILKASNVDAGAFTEAEATFPGES